MGLQIAGFTIANIAEVDLTPKALRVIPYDAAANTMVPVAGATAAATQGFTPIAGLHGNKTIQSRRVGEEGESRVTSEVQLWQDCFNVATINAFWTQSLTTMTAVQALGLLTLNNAAITTLNTAAIITSLRQFPKYPRQPIFCRWRARITANVAANHTLVEIGLGNPVGVTVIVNNGCFFRWRADGGLEGIISYNGTEQTTTLLAQGVISTTKYYYYDVVVHDDYVRFTVTDSSNVPVVDRVVYITDTQPMTWALNHLPSFTRVYVDTTGGGTAIQLLLSEHQVQLEDAVNNKQWDDQTSACMRQASINPTLYTQTPTLANAAVSAAVTPTNTTVTTSTLGGEYNNLATAGAETLMSIFGFTIPTPFSFYLKGINISAPLIQGAAVVTAAVLEWFLAPNASTANLSTATGLQRIPLPGFHTALAAAAIGTRFSGGDIVWMPKVPILCLPGTILHIGYKSITGAATALLAYRGQVTIDGYFE